MKYELHPCYFITDFVTAIFEHRSVALLMLSHPPLPIKRIKQKKKTFGLYRTCGLLFLFYFTFTIKISNFKFLAVSHIFFLNYKRKKKEREEK